MQRPQLKQEKGSQREGTLEVAGSAETTTEAGKGSQRGGGALEVAGSAKTTTEAGKRLSKGGDTGSYRECKDHN